MNSFTHRHLDQGCASVAEFGMLEALGSMWGVGGHRKKLIKFKVTLKPGCPVSGLYARLLSELL